MVANNRASVLSVSKENKVVEFLFTAVTSSVLQFEVDQLENLPQVSVGDEASSLLEDIENTF